MKVKNLNSINGIPAIGALVGVGFGIFSKAGIFGTLILGTAMAGLGYYIQNKFD